MVSTLCATIMSTLPDAASRTGHPSGNEAAHHKIANKPNTPINMSKTAAVMAIGRMAL